MISPDIRKRIAAAITAGYTDYVAAERCGVHFHTIREWRRALERAGVVPVITARINRRGRVLNTAAMTQHIHPSRRPQAQTRRLKAIGEALQV
jgi:transposase